MRNLSQPVRILSSLLAFSICALAQTPTALTVKSATSSQVALTWSGTAASYTVQRAQVGGGFLNIATVTTPSFTDTNIDPYNQFFYQITVANSGTSNQVITGPPPAGLSLAAQAPAVGNDPDDGYGVDAILTFDGNGDPACSFLWVDPAQAGNARSEQLLFRSWNRAKAAWNPVVKIAVVGGSVGGIDNKGHDPLALAYDATSGTYVLATESITGAIVIYTSTDGAAWTVRRTITPKHSASAPSVAVAGGNFFLTFQSDAVGLQFMTGKITSDPATWTLKTAPEPPGAYFSGVGANAAVAVDSSGTPAVAVLAGDNNSGYNEILLFWRPLGTAVPTRILDSQNFQNDYQAVKMTFYKTNPRIISYIYRGDADPGLGVHFSRSDDGGTTWQDPVVIPPDGNSSTDYPFGIAIDSKGNGAIEFGQNSGSGGDVCASPKLSRSSDLVHWTTCSLSQSIGMFSGVPRDLNLAFQGNDKLYSLWWNVDNVANTGVVLYREPPDNVASGPVISSVLDAESARATLVPGEWVAIYGANLAGLSRTWDGSDFNNGNNLPMGLSGTSVKFNGIPAAVFYVSPSQLDVQVPSGISGSVPVVVTANGAVSTPFMSTIVPNAPSFYVYPAGGKLYPAAVHLNGDLVGDPAALASAKKVKSGETLIFFVNGLASAPSGVIISGAVAYSSPLTFSVTGPGSSTASVNATVSFAGLVAAGEYQLNVVVPGNLAPGDYTMTIATQGQSSPGSVILPVSN